MKCCIRTFLTLCTVSTLAVLWNSPLQCLPEMRSKYTWNDPDKFPVTCFTGVTFSVQHALYFKLLKFVFPYFSQLFFFNTLSAGIEVSIKPASMFSLKANRGSVCYNLLVAEHGFVSTVCGTHLYHLSPAIFTVTSLETFRRPYHTVYAVSSNCSHICSFQYLCRKHLVFNASSRTAITPLWIFNQLDALLTW
jgi:hypothetical protein